MQTRGHVDGFKVAPLEDGNVSLKLMQGDEEVVSGALTPAEISQVVAALLTGAWGAFDNLEKDPVEISLSRIQHPITANRWVLASTPVRGQFAVVAQIGEAVVGLTIERSQMRQLARALLIASRRPESAAPAHRLLQELFADFFFDLKEWGSLLKARLRAAFQLRATSFSSWASGRSLRLFRTIDVSPDICAPKYAPVGKCIYCSSLVYSEQPGFRRAPLGTEHIIPEGLDGKLELPEASCHKCEVATSKLERDVLLRTLKALRLYLKIRGKRKSSRPKSLPLTDSTGGANRIIQMPIEDYPVIFNMPVYGSPGLFSGAPGGNQTTSGFTLIILKHDARMLRKKYGITSFASPVWDTHTLFRMLGKIGHSLAVAELGSHRFVPLLREMIMTESTDMFNHIGGEPRLGPSAAALHELGLGYQRANGKDYVVAKIRLFARHNGPTYYVVVGESLESAGAKFKRVLSRRVSRILAPRNFRKAQY